MDSREDGADSCRKANRLRKVRDIIFQQIILIGNLGSDPELRFTPSGVAVASFSLAVNRSWTGADGERKDKSTWFRISVWNKQAETVTQYLNKGSKVMVVGEVEEARVFTGKDGNARASLEVKAQQVKFMDGKKDSGDPTDNVNVDSSEPIPF